MCINNMKNIINTILILLSHMTILPVESITFDNVRDSHNCLINRGFTWCHSSQECMRQWEIPCSDNYDDCSDCLRKQINGENIACPGECDNAVIDCIDDSDCGSSHFCRPVMRNNEATECYKYSNEGDTCSGYTSSMYESRCNTLLDCVHSKINFRPSVPMPLNSPGICEKKCIFDSPRNEYGTCIISFDNRH